ncbi:unannotated protein [freshwater metagenome]|uniref:Unannotated protein n=1 Tax=freshwater metagenome TaxID=449393 RepID=A0A6J7EVD1_9ZZZZ
MNRHPGYALGVLKVMQRLEQHLGSVHREGWDHHGATPLDSSRDRGGHGLKLRVEIGVLAVAVRRLDDDRVGRGRGGWRNEQRMTAAPEVAAEDDGLRSVGQGDDRGAKDVPGWVEPSGDVRQCREVSSEFDRTEHRDGTLRVTRPVEGAGLGMLGEALAPGELGVLLLEPGAVAKHDRCEGSGVRRAEDRTLEAIAREGWQVPAVIEMRVAEGHRGDLVRGDRERLPVAQAQVAGALEEPAVDEEAATRGLKEGLRTSDGLVGAEECEKHCSQPPRSVMPLCARE